MSVNHNYEKTDFLPFQWDRLTTQCWVFLCRHDTHFPNLKSKTYTEKSTFESQEPRTAHLSDQLLKLSDGEMAGRRGEGRKPLKRSRPAYNQMSQHDHADVNYEIKLSEDFFRTAKGFGSSCSPETPIITFHNHFLCSRKIFKHKQTLIVGSTM